VASEVNNLHIRGYGIKDDTQRPFFINGLDGSSNNIDMSNIELNPDMNEFDNIAAGEMPSNVEDNRIALAISTLRQTDMFSADKYILDSNSTERKHNSDEFYRNIIAELGNLGQEANTAAKAQQFLTEQIDYRRQAVSAVSMDEEMSNLIKYEHSYSAAARIVNAMDEMLDVIVNKVGLVGR
jgi:flagellar hook-associated protein 1 FlgK